VQLFINELRCTHLVLMKSKGEAHSSLRNFFDNVGLPDLIISDNSWEQGASVYGSQAWKGTLQEFGVAHRFIEPYKYRQNTGVEPLEITLAITSSYPRNSLYCWLYSLGYDPLYRARRR